LPERQNFDGFLGQPGKTGVERPKVTPRYLRIREGQIVSDAKYRGMYRIRWRDGRLSDMVNYTRAVAALRGL
jgi:hypothetical protein